MLKIFKGLLPKLGRIEILILVIFEKKRFYICNYFKLMNIDEDREGSMEDWVLISIRSRDMSRWLRCEHMVKM